MTYKIFLSIFFLLPNFLFAASSNGYQFNFYYVIPFIGILLSIAIFPLINEHFWHNNFGKISTFWALLFSVPFIINAGLTQSMHYFAHAFFLEYIPFIILLFALFTISGGILVNGNFVGTPKFNFILLLIGTSLASWMGTTGAAMLLIRPLIRANKWRNDKTHIIIFFIFLVANIGGSLTPLGDPPLFIGFLKGIDFFWTTKYMFTPMLFVSVLVLIIFYFVDNYFYKKETNSQPNQSSVNFSIEGKVNFILLFFVIVSVILSGIYKDSLGYVSIFNNKVKLSFLLRDIILFVLAILSYKITSLNLRKKNGFTWFPIQEVGKLFAGIFITVIPALSLLSKNQESFSSLTDNMYFWITGILSAFLDNAPTYLVFFTSTGLNPDQLMNGISLLLAISSGAVFMGAMTYIGNAPNFMVRAIAEENDIKMPGFFGYMMWSFVVLVPIFILYTYIWF